MNELESLCFELESSSFSDTDTSWRVCELVCDVEPKLLSSFKLSYYVESVIENSKECWFQVPVNISTYMPLIIHD